MTTDPIINPQTPPSDPSGEPKRKRIRCDFCECELGADGGVLKTSDKAKGFERANVTIADLTRANNDLQGTLDTAKQELEELRAPKPPAPEPQVDDPARHVPSRVFTY